MEAELDELDVVGLLDEDGIPTGEQMKCEAYKPWMHGGGTQPACQGCAGNGKCEWSWRSNGQMLVDERLARIVFGDEAVDRSWN